MRGLSRHNDAKKDLRRLTKASNQPTPLATSTAFCAILPVLGSECVGQDLVKSNGAIKLVKLT